MEPGDSPEPATVAVGLQNHATRGPSPLSVLWIDDAQLSRECIVAAVAATLPHFAFHMLHSVEECLAHDGLRPELVVYYSHSGNTIDLDAIQAVRTTYPHAHLVVLSDATSVSAGAVRGILSRDVAGFILTRQTGLQMVASAITLVHSGGTFVPRDFLFTDSEAESGTVAGAAPETARLTQRELDVLECIREGSPNKRIAEELAMSASTVKVHVRNIMQKLGASNRTQVALGADVYLQNNHHK